MFRLEFCIDREETIKSKFGKGVFSLFHNNIKIISWYAVSGGWGKGEMDLGDYTIKSVRELPNWAENDPYKKESFPWIAGPLIPTFKTDRTQICIHPDGNVYGSLGCIAIQNNDVALFHFLKAILATQKEISLTVIKKLMEVKK